MLLTTRGQGYFGQPQLGMYHPLEELLPSFPLSLWFVMVGRMGYCSTYGHLVIRTYTEIAIMVAYTCLGLDTLCRFFGGSPSLDLSAYEKRQMMIQSQC